MKAILSFAFVMLLSLTVHSQSIVVEHGDTLVQFNTHQLKQINRVVIEHAYLTIENTTLTMQVSNLREQVSICERAKSDMNKIIDNNEQYVSELKELHNIELQRSEEREKKSKKQRNTWVGVSTLLTVFLTLSLI